MFKHYHIRASVTSDKVDWATLPAVETAFTPSGTGDWRTAATIDLSSFPDGAKIEIILAARAAPTGTTTLGLRLSDTTSKATLYSTTTANEFATLNNSRIITKSSNSILVQILGIWNAENTGWYSVRRVG